MTTKQHRPVRAGNPDRPTVICSECLVVWPCLTVQRAAAMAANAAMAALTLREKEMAKARQEMRDNGASDLFEAES
jgi:hypothetical protein